MSDCLKGKSDFFPGVLEACGDEIIAVGKNCKYDCEEEPDPHSCPGQSAALAACIARVKGSGGNNGYGGAGNDGYGGAGNNDGYGGSAGNYQQRCIQTCMEDYPIETDPTGYAFCAAGCV